MYRNMCPRVLVHGGGPAGRNIILTHGNDLRVVNCRTLLEDVRDLGLVLSGSGVGMTGHQRDAEQFATAPWSLLGAAPA